MTGKADFTEQEWELVREGPTAAGMYALMASKGGSFRESWALSKTYAEARQERGESELLDALVAEKPPVKRYDSAEQLEHEGLAKLSQAVELLEQKAIRRGRSRATGTSSSRSRGASPRRTRRTAKASARRSARRSRRSPRACIRGAPRQPARPPLPPPFSHPSARAGGRRRGSSSPSRSAPG